MARSQARSARLHELDEDTAHRSRMHERDQGVPRALPGHAVHQARALRAQFIQRGGDVTDPIGDVVKARSTRRERPSYRGVRPDRPEQLDERGPDREQHFVDPLILDAFPVDRLDPQHRAVPLDRILQIFDRDPHVIDVHEMDRHASPITISLADPSGRDPIRLPWMLRPRFPRGLDIRSPKRAEGPIAG